MKNSSVVFTFIIFSLFITACNKPNKEKKMEEEANQLLEEMGGKESTKQPSNLLNEVNHIDSSIIKN